MLDNNLPSTNHNMTILIYFFMWKFRKVIEDYIKALILKAESPPYV